MNSSKRAFQYLVFDYITALFAWALLFLFRKIYLEPQKFGYEVPLEFGYRFYIGLAIVPIFWIFVYYTSGYYSNPYKKSRLKELWGTLWISCFGTAILFFSLLLDDVIASYHSYYQSLFFYACTHFILTLIPRMFLTFSTVKKIHQRILGFPTLIVGSDEKAIKLYQEMESAKKSSGYKFVGFIGIKSCKDSELLKYLPCLGTIKSIKEIIHNYNIQEVILAIESNEHQKIQKILRFLQIERPVSVKIIPDLYSILSGQVKMQSILGTPLIEINHEIMPKWQKVMKRVMDISISLLVLICFSFLFLFIALLVKLSSKGPVIYSHERLGKYGKPFKIYKFRSMYTDAEQNTPLLASDNDPRITPIGLFLRKTRMDELPQFYNVLIGNMSLVGPRPERKYFVDQIIKTAPHYVYLHRVKPGITSWGQVKFGYAQNVDEMIERLKYDVLYIENMSIFIDLKILIYTILIIIQGRGK